MLAVIATLAGAQHVQNAQARQNRQQGLFGGYVHRCAAVQHDLETGEIERSAVEGIQQRPGEGVPDQGQQVDLFRPDGPQHLRRIETPHGILDYQRIAGAQAIQGDPLPRRMHEGRGRQDPGAALFRPRRQFLRLLDDGAVPGPAAAQNGNEDIPLTPQHALGQARGAARIQGIQIIGAAPLHQGF